MTDPVGKQSASRRDFLKTSAVVAAGAAAVNLAGGNANAHSAGSDVIKVGLVGCGGRGTGAAEQSITASTNIKLHAMADLFKDHLDGCHGEAQGAVRRPGRRRRRPQVRRASTPTSG